MRFPGVDQTVALNYEAGGWASADALSNPTLGTVAADTGQLAAGLYDLRFIVTSTGAAIVSIQHRNAANTEALHRHITHFGTLEGNYHMELYSYRLAANERFTIVLEANLTGDFFASITWARRV